jgi:hypothetical protein
MKVTAEMFNEKDRPIDILRKAERKKYAVTGRIQSTKKEKDEERSLKHMEETEYVK